MKELQKNGEFMPVLKWKIKEEENRKETKLLLFEIDEKELFYSDLDEEFPLIDED
jgi:hypothetical protein